MTETSAQSNQFEVYEVGDTKYHDLTLADLDDEGNRNAIAYLIEAWLPNHTDDSGRVVNYDDLLNRIEGPFPFTGHEDVHLSLGDDTDSPVYRKVRRMAERIAKEARDG